jgi:hypothetical protein
MSERSSNGEYPNRKTIWRQTPTGSLEYLTLKLVSPTTWRKICETCPDSPSFNWFICSKRYFDKRRGAYIISLFHDTQLYDPVSGKMYIVKPGEEVKLYLLDDLYNQSHKPKFFGSECDSDILKVYDGCVSQIKSDSNPKFQEDQIFCNDIMIIVDSSKLKEIDKDKCKVICRASAKYGDKSAYNEWLEKLPVDKARKKLVEYLNVI